MVWKTKIVDKLSHFEIFIGAFLSSILTFIGFGYFLRLGWILSFSGIELLSSVCLFGGLICGLTIFSISWMLSNIKLEDDSLYFLLSRTFGVDVAFSIALPLFISQALSGSFYILGVCEVVHYFFPFCHISLLTFSLYLFVLVVSLRKSNYLVKSEIVVFILVLATLLTIFFNPLLIAQKTAHIKPSIGFWETFTLFFPLITGIESILGGYNQKKFSPKVFVNGVFSGFWVSLVFYLSMLYFLHAHVSQESLQDDLLVMRCLSVYPYICFVTILSTGALAIYSAISSATQTLKSLAADTKIIGLISPHAFSLGLTFFVTGFGLLMGNINKISPLLTLFFLISYGMINTATGLEAWIGNPSWRPTLKGHYLFSLVGALSCFVTLLMISPGFCLICSCVILLLYLSIKQKKIVTSWDDFRYSILLFLSRSLIYKINQLIPSPKTWRPNLLVFIGDPLLRTHLTQISCDLTHKKGFLIFSSILADYDANSYESKKLHLFLEKKEIPGLVKIKTASSLLDGMRSLIENVGLGSLSPNTIVLGASKSKEKIPLIAELILFIHRSQKNLVLIKESSSKSTFALKKTIHLWWGAKNRINSELMIIFSHMLKNSTSWKGADIILKTVVNHADEIGPTKQKLLTFMEESRVFFDTSVILHEHGDIFINTIQQQAACADLIFLGLKAPEIHETVESYAKYYTSLIEKTEGFPTIAFVLAGEPLEFSKILH